MVKDGRAAIGADIMMSAGQFVGSQRMLASTAGILPAMNPPSANVVEIVFGVLSPKTIEDLAVAEVNNERNYKYHVAERGSVNDPRMGTCDEFMDCQSCADNSGNCPGHMGIIRFCMPLFMPELLAQHLFKVLRVTCWNCARCLVRPDNSSYHKVSKMVDSKKKMTRLMQLSDNIKVCGKYSRRIDFKRPKPPALSASRRKKRRRHTSKGGKEEEEEEEEEVESGGEEKEEEEEISAVDKMLRDGCGAAQPLYEQDGVLIRAIFSLTAAHGSDPALPIPQFDLNTIFEMLSYIPDEDVRLMDIGGRPEDFLFTKMAVIPPIARPTISRTVGSHVRGQADLSKTLKNIGTLNMNVKKWIDAHPNDTANLAVYEYAGFKHTDPNIVIEYAKQWDACGGQVEHLVDFTANSGGTKKSRKLKRPTRKVAAALAAAAAAHAEANPEAAATAAEKVNNKENASAAVESVPWTTRKKAAKTLRDLYIELQVAVAQFSNSELGAKYIKTRTHGTKSKGMRQYYTGKHGRIRGDNTGKRTGLCGRTVITPDPNVGLDEIGVPEEFCRIMIRQERVSPFNIRRFTNMVRSGDIRHVTNQFGELLDLNFIKRQTVLLNYGDIIERPLQNGDRLPFNRQPSLHKLSIMSHKVKVLPGGTYRMPPGATTPYNADCDGDEMAGWAVNNQPSRAEARYLTAAKEHIVAAAASKPIMSTVQDGLSGLYILTGQDVFLTRAQMMQLVVESGLADTWELPQPAIRSRHPITREWTVRWTGKQLFSMLLPEDYLLDPSSDAVAGDLRSHFALLKKQKGESIINSSRDQSFVKDARRGLIIRCGQLLHGQLLKQWMGNSESGIVHTLFHDYGPTFASDFLSRAQLMATNGMMIKSITVGPTDCQQPNPAATKPIVERALAFVNQFDDHDPVSGNAHTEEIIERVLSGARDHVGDLLLQQLDDQTERDGFDEIARSGAKGSSIDQVQVHALLGQQNQKSKRLDDKLPQFPGLSHAKRHGFVERSFFEGLDDIEFFFHAVGGREGLSDTACKTAETGYTQKRLCNGMKNHTVRNDGTVRNTAGVIISFKYGDDGFDASRLVESPLHSLKISKRQLRERFSAMPGDWEKEVQDNGDDDVINCSQQWEQWMPLLTPDAARRFLDQVSGGAGEGSEETAANKALRTEWQTIETLRNQLRSVLLRNHPRLVDRVMLPINFERLMGKLEQRQRKHAQASSESRRRQSSKSRGKVPPPLPEYKEERRSDMTPWEVHLTVRAFYDELLANNVIPNNCWKKQQGQPGNGGEGESGIIDAMNEDESPLYNLMLSMAEWLSTHRLVRVHRVSRDDLRWLLRHIGCKLLLAQVAPGEAVGILGGTSIGERSTQMTLNSVDYHTDLIIRWHSLVGAERYGCIGKMIDELMEEFPERIIKYPNDTLYLPLDKGVAEALTVGEDGNVSWKQLEAVTKHPPNNADGSNTLVKITTEAGRSVTATRAKSFLVFNAETRKIEDVNGDSLKVGDLVPVTLLRANGPQTKASIDLGSIFDPTEFIFTSSPLSKHVQLTRAFGFFIGAYLAKGRLTDHQVHISNNDDEGYRIKSAEWPTLMDIDNHESLPNAVATSIMFHSTIVTHLLRKTCGSDSWNKRVPTFAYSAPLEFVLGLLDGYISGDGSVARNGAITSSSRSLALTEGIALLFSMLNIRPTITVGKLNRDENDLIMHTLYIDTPEVVRVRETLTLCIGHKQQRMLDAKSKYKPMAKTTARYESRNLVDTWMDPIVKIEPIESSHPHVYDLTVAKTRNMVTASGLAVRDSFHKAGDTNALVGGVPRFNEIINKSPNQKTPSMKLVIVQACIEAAIAHLADGTPAAYPSAAAYAQSLASGLVRVNLDGFLCAGIADSVCVQGWKVGSSSSSSSSSERRRHPKSKKRRRRQENEEADLDWLWSRFEWALPPVEQRAQFTSAAIQLHLDRAKCLVHRVSVLDIVGAIQQQIGRDHIFVHSLPSDKEWWVCIRVRKSSSTWASLRNSLSPPNHPTAKSATAQEANMWETTASSQKKKEIEGGKGEEEDEANAVVLAIKQLAGKPDAVWQGAVSGEPGAPHEQYMCRTLVDCLLHETRICGLRGILSAHASVERYTHIVSGAEAELQGPGGEEEGSTVMRSRWVVNTAGTNIMGAAHIEEFDFSESYTNSIHDTEPNFGIEASQLWIELEVNTVLDATGGNVNARHTKQLDEGMTARGYVTPMTRNGISKQDLSVLERISFEKPMEHMANASVRGERDPVSGPQECVYANNLAPLGTGTVDLRNMPRPPLPPPRRRRLGGGIEEELQQTPAAASAAPSPSLLPVFSSLGHLTPSRDVALANDLRVRRERSFIPAVEQHVVDEYFSKDPLDMAVEQACLWPRAPCSSAENRRRQKNRLAALPLVPAAAVDSEALQSTTTLLPEQQLVPLASLDGDNRETSLLSSPNSSDRKKKRINDDGSSSRKRARTGSISGGFFMSRFGQAFVPASSLPLFVQRCNTVPAPSPSLILAVASTAVSQQHAHSHDTTILATPTGVGAATQERTHHQKGGDGTPRSLGKFGGSGLRMHSSSTFVMAEASDRFGDLLSIPSSKLDMDLTH